MKVKGRTVKWLQVGFVVAVSIAAHAVHAGSADAAPVPAARDASAAPGAVVLGGITSQNLPVVFRVSGDGRTLTLGEIAVSMNCTSGTHFVLPDEYVRVPISTNGRLHANFAGLPTVGSGGGSYTWTDSMTGRLNRTHTKLSGVWRLSVSYSYTDGTSDQCDSGPVQFTAE